MTPAAPPVLYISADTSDLTTRYKATPRMHMGADAWIPRDAVRVKPLGPWRDSSVPANGFCHAIAAFGTYFIERNSDGFFWVFHDDRGVAHCKGIEAAKAAAQADFEARVMSALAALPAPDEGEQDEGEGNDV